MKMPEPYMILRILPKISRHAVVKLREFYRKTKAGPTDQSSPSTWRPTDVQPPAPVAAPFTKPQPESKSPTAEKHLLTERELIILTDLFYLRGRIYIRSWHSYPHMYLQAAAMRLAPHARIAVVLANLVWTSVQDDREDTDRCAQSILGKNLPELGLPLLYARTYEPDSWERERRLWVLWNITSSTDADAATATALAIHRARELSSDANEDIRALAHEILEDLAQPPEPMEILPMVEMAKEMALALYHPGPAGMEACEQFMSHNWLVGLALTILRYVNPPLVELTEEAMKSLPAPPVALRPGFHVRDQGKSAQAGHAGALLAATAPAVKTWLDLDLPHLTFEEDNGQVAAAVRQLVETMPQLQSVVRSFSMPGEQVGIGTEYSWT